MLQPMYSSNTIETTTVNYFYTVLALGIGLAFQMSTQQSDNDAQIDSDIRLRTW